MKSVEPGSKLEITYRSEDPDQAMKIANQVARIYTGEGKSESANELGSAVRLGKGDHIIRVAALPKEPSGPGRVQIIAAGLFFGLLLGLGAAVLTDLVMTGSGRSWNRHRSVPT